MSGVVGEAAIEASNGAYDVWLGRHTAKYRVGPKAAEAAIGAIRLGGNLTKAGHWAEQALGRLCGDKWIEPISNGHLFG